MVMRKKTDFILGKPLIPHAGVRSWYTKELDALVKKMDERTRKRVLEIFEKAAKSGGNVEAQERMALNELNKYYAELFKRKAKELATSMVSKQNRNVSSAVRASVEGFGAGVGLKKIKTTVMPKKLRQDLKAAIQENVTYISSIQKHYSTQVEGAIYRAIVNGTGVSALQDELLKYGADSKRRARNIAKDQSHKAYEAISRERLKEAGFKYWQWEHGGGTKTVRPFHVADAEANGINHTIHKIGEKAYDEHAIKLKKGKYKGKWIYPGELPFCSCRMRPVLKFD